MLSSAQCPLTRCACSLVRTCRRFAGATRACNRRWSGQVQGGAIHDEQGSCDGRNARCCRHQVDILLHACNTYFTCAFEVQRVCCLYCFHKVTLYVRDVRAKALLSLRSGQRKKIRTSFQNASLAQSIVAMCHCNTEWPYPLRCKSSEGIDLGHRQTFERCTRFHCATSLHGPIPDRIPKKDAKVFCTPCWGIWGMMAAQPPTIDLRATDLRAILQNGRGVAGELATDPNGG